MELGLTIALAFGLDLVFADPKQLPHPIRLIGTLIKKCEKFFRKNLDKTPSMEFVGGVATVLLLCTLSYLVPLIILWTTLKINNYLHIAVQCFMCFQILAAGSLKNESMKVYNALKSGNIELSRKYLSWIVGRDTAQLDEQSIIKATVETVAENTTDAVIAPLIFMAIGGAPLGFLYKAVNTMDSMIGYKNEKYYYFGKTAAKLDDLLNFIPARLSAILMILASKMLNLNSKNALKILKRDGNNHSSPNSGKTEAACAGALEIQLGGPNYYFGKLVEKPTIGENIQNPKPNHIILANQLMYMSSLLATSVTVLILIIGGSI